MFEVTVTRADEDTARLETTIFFDNELSRKAEYLNDLENVIAGEVENYTGFAAQVDINPFYKEADIVVFLGWDPISLGDDIQDLVVAADYARDRIEKEAKE